MQPKICASVIIPVLNHWELTERCLRSLAATVPAGQCEVIVVDNGSTDATAVSCPALGASLFGALFHYHRAEQNLNFGPAANWGTKMAGGEYLIFLNNDTVLLPGWYEPLLDDFIQFPDIAATGPVLLSPSAGILGATVQHLGMFVSPDNTIGHLYEGIPAISPVAQKRRFFQVISAACMMIPRMLFAQYAGFDERYTNGFEAVDLCARLWAAGYKMTVNPNARMYHLTSQTHGCHDNACENARICTETIQQHLRPDWHIHAQHDGLALRVTPWQTLCPAMSPEQEQELSVSTPAAIGALTRALQQYPFWYAGYTKLHDLFARSGAHEEQEGVLLTLARLNPQPDVLMMLMEVAKRTNNVAATNFAIHTLFAYCASSEKYQKNAIQQQGYFQSISIPEIAEQYAAWSTQEDTFYSELYIPLLRKLRQQFAHIKLMPQTDWGYVLWRELYDIPARREKLALAPPHPQVRISILMPVYTPEHAHLREAVASIQAQSHPHWELCMVYDASTAPIVRTLLTELAAGDSRITATFCETIGHVAAMSNTALEMAAYSYVALMGQDGLLSPDALAEVVESIFQKPLGMLFYSDEDTVTDEKIYYDPYFKPDWDPVLIRSRNYVSHLGVYKTERLRAIGGFRTGFDGAQDYDMLLRYISGLDFAEIVHIPKVLYHGRGNGKNTARNGVENNSDPRDASSRAVQEYLERERCSATLEQRQGDYLQPLYTIPSPLPLVSVLIDLGHGIPLAPSLTEAIVTKAKYNNVEIIFICNDNDPYQIKQYARKMETRYAVRFLPLPATLLGPHRLNKAAIEAQGDMLGVMDKNIIPCSEGWLRFIVGQLCQKDVGVVGGKLLAPSGNVQSIGHMADSRGALFSFGRKPLDSDRAYFGWEESARTVASVDPRCFFTRTALFRDASGCDPAMGVVAAVDYCLRLGERGVRTVTEPRAEFLFTKEMNVPWDSEHYLCDPKFVMKWYGRVPPCNPNLEGGQAGNWALKEPWPTHVFATADGISVQAGGRQAKDASLPFTLLMIAHDFTYGGGQYALLRLLRTLHACGSYDMGILALGDGPLAEEFSKCGMVEVVRDMDTFAMMGQRPTPLEISFVLQRLLARMPRRPDCIIANTVIASLALPHVKDLGIPVVSIISELKNNFTVNVSPTMLTDLLAHTTRFAPASSAAGDLLRQLGVPEEKITVIHGAIDDYPTTLDTERRNALLASLGVDENIPLLWGCGELSVIKGPDLFYEVCRQLKSMGTVNFHAVWAGKPHVLFTDWFKQVQECGKAEANVSFLGFVAKAYRLMAPGDIFMLSSREDCFPLAMLEAAERGLPVVAFKGSGGAEEFITPEIGVTVPYANTAMMARAVASLLTDKERRLRMGDESRHTVLTKHTSEHMAQRFAGLMREVTAK